jgi:hypothetical protein
MNSMASPRLLRCQKRGNFPDRGGFLETTNAVISDWRIIF